jgi:drug/metabolite transporter (DMT)-like permease
LTPPATRPPSRALAAALVAVQCLIWGSTWVVIRGGLRDLPPFTSAAARFWVAGAAMAAAAALLGRREGGTAPEPLLWVAMGTLNFALSYGIVYWTETRLPSGLVAVLWAVFPLLMALSTRWFLHGARLGAAQWFGFVVGFGGVVTLFWTDVAAFGRAGLLAALVLLGSPLASAIGTTLVKRRGEGASSLALNRNGMLLGALLLTLVAAIAERDAPARWTLPAVASVVYLALLGTAVAFGLYFWLLRWADAHKLSLIAYVTPAIALALGTLAAGEPFRLTTLSGGALVLAGVMLVVRR